MVSIFAFLLSAVLITTTTVFAYMSNPITKKMNVGQLHAIRAVRGEVIEKGCNINLCFAIDGSSSISRDEFKTQKDFVELVLDIVRMGSARNFAAVQYGTIVKPVSLLTENRKLFREKLKRTGRIGGSTNLRDPLAFCAFQFAPRVGEANKILMIGSGFDINYIREPSIVDFLSRERIGVFAIAVGSGANVGFLNRLTGNAGCFVIVQEHCSLGDVTVDVVRSMCGFK